MIFDRQDGVTLKQAYDMYKIYCDEAQVDYKMAKYKFREELKNYFRRFDAMKRVDDKQVRNYYSEFMREKFTDIVPAGQKTDNSEDIIKKD